MISPTMYDPTELLGKMAERERGIRVIKQCPICRANMSAVPHSYPLEIECRNCGYTERIKV